MRVIEEIKRDVQDRMYSSINALTNEFSKIRTGRASARLLDHVMVEYYGSRVPVSQTATVAIEDARTITITPWENSLAPIIEKAIINSDLGLNPNTTGTVIRVIMPTLTEERRKGLVRSVRHEAEKTRVAIRNIRRGANADFKVLVKEKEISKDEEHRAQENVQELTDQFIKEVESLLEQKERDLMEV